MSVFASPKPNAWRLHGSNADLCAIFVQGVAELVTFADPTGEEALLAHVVVEALEAPVPATRKDNAVVSSAELAGSGYNKERIPVII